MSGNKRPLAVTILGCVYILVGSIGFVYHFAEIRQSQAFPFDGVWVELVRLAAIVFGAFILRGQNWARWGALAWIAFHVIVSAFHSLGEFAMHGLFFGVIAWFLFRSEAVRFFHAGRIAPT